MGRRKRPICHLDAISEDVILCSILSLLTLRDAVRTSVLSRRWRHIWQHLSILNFNSDNVFGSDVLDIPVENLVNVLSNGLLTERMEKFIESVSAVVQHHRGDCIQAFKGEFFLDRKYAKYIDKWLDFAFNLEIKELDLKLSVESIRHLGTEKPYEFPCHLFAGQKGKSIEHLCLVFCSLKLPPKFDGCNNLKSLDLNLVDMSQSDIHSILSNCYSLERLTIRRSKELVNLKISEKLEKLKYLNVGWCAHLDKIEIYAINITTFKYTGGCVSLIFGDLPLLTNTCIHFRSWDSVIDYLPKLPSILPHLQTLDMEMYPGTEVVIPKGFSRFTHLKQLVLSIWATAVEDLAWVASLLNAAPLLEKFELHLRYADDLIRRNIRRLPDCPHSHLKTVEISGFTGIAGHVELAIFLLKNAIPLELMIINPRMREIDEPWLRKWMRTDFVAPGARKRAREYLRREVRPNTKLRIL